MASAVGMTIRTSKANERIDAALAVLAAGGNAPAKPAKVRDALYNDVLRVEWIADTLEALNGTDEPAEMVEVPNDAELTGDGTGEPLPPADDTEKALDAPKVARKPRKAAN